MTVPQHRENAGVAQLDQRGQALEDVHAMRHLKARAAASCDDQYTPDGLAALCTEEAGWESQGLGRLEGREAMRAFFRGASPRLTFAIHDSLHGQMDGQGDTARAQWSRFMPCTLGERHRAMGRAGVDHEEYVRVAGEWQCKRNISAPLFHPPFEEGWATTQLV